MASSQQKEALDQSFQAFRNVQSALEAKHGFVLKKAQITIPDVNTPISTETLKQLLNMLDDISYRNREIIMDAESVRDAIFRWYKNFGPDKETI